MARTFEVEIGDEVYRGDTASAKAQFEALHILLRTHLIVAVQDGAHSEMGTVTAFAGAALSDVQRLVELVMKGRGDSLVYRDSDNVPVAENLFQDNIELYYLLLAKVLRENLSGFWQLRRQTAAKVAEQTNS